MTVRVFEGGCGLVGVWAYVCVCLCACLCVCARVGVYLRVCACVCVLCGGMLGNMRSLQWVADKCLLTDI